MSRLILLLAFLALGCSAHAEPLKKAAPKRVGASENAPDRMEPLEARRLESAFLRLQLLRQAIAAAQKEAEPHEAVIKGFAERYQLGPNDDVNFETGKITRPPPKREAGVVK